MPFPLPAPLRSVLRLATLVVALWIGCAGLAKADVPADRLATLRHGLNITHWFRYPPRSDENGLRNYLGDDALAQIRAAGFTFVRLAVQPELMLAGGRPDDRRLDVLVGAISRVQRHGLGVMIGWHPQTWQLEKSPEQQQALLSLWEALAAKLPPLPAALTFPEALNEPVFPDRVAWEQLQNAVLARIRSSLPNNTVVLTGNHWGALDGMLALHPVADPDVVYTYHTYDPMILTTLAAFEPSLDRQALARLPFPADKPGACQEAEAATTHGRTRDVIRYYCSEKWNAERVQKEAHAAGEWARAHHVPVVVGEFGIINRLRPETRLAWITAARQAFEREGLGWAFWGYDDGMGFDLHPEGGRSPPLDPSILNALGLHAGR
jgi:aryl-phospho-beta-D-glucosidase BglC (GH1 family)